MVESVVKMPWFVPTQYIYKPFSGKLVVRLNYASVDFLKFVQIYYELNLPQKIFITLVDRKSR